MRKFYFILLLMPFAFLFGQNMVNNPSFESWTDPSTPTSWDVYEMITQDSDHVHQGSFSARHQGGTSRLAQLVQGFVPGNTYEISIWFKTLEGTGDGTDARIWSYWRNSDNQNVSDPNTDAALRGPNNAYFDNNGHVWTNYNVQVVAPETATAMNFEMRTYSGAVVHWDNLSITCVDCDGTTPSLSVSTPTPNQIFAVGTETVEIDFNTNNFTVGTAAEGADGHIHYTVNDGAVQMHFSNDPIQIDGIAPGAYQISLWLVDNNHNPLEPAVSTQVSFSIPTSNTVNSIAELRAGTQDGSVYALVSEAILTMQQNFRNQKWIQDATGAILIDDVNGVLATTYNLYDGITGIVGTLTTHNGLLQFVPQQAGAPATSTANSVEPLEITVDEFNNNLNAYESQLVKIVGLNAQEVGNWATGVNYNFSGNQGSIIVRTNFYDADYIGTPIPTETVDIIGIAAEFNGTSQLWPRMQSDFMSSMSVSDLNAAVRQVSVAVVNNTLSVSNFTPVQTMIYNFNGSVVAKSAFVGQLPQGNYIAVMVDADGNQVSVKFRK